MPRKSDAREEEPDTDEGASASEWAVWIATGVLCAGAYARHGLVVALLYWLSTAALCALDPSLHSLQLLKLEHCKRVLAGVPNVLWIVAEDAAVPSASVRQLLHGGRVGASGRGELRVELAAAAAAEAAGLVGGRMVGACLSPDGRADALTGRPALVA